MTLQGHKNHYNVKLLRGYGASISLKKNKVSLRGGKDVLTGQQEIEEWFVTQIPYERIVVAGKGYVSTDAIQLLTDHNINVILLDSLGNLVCNMSRLWLVTLQPSIGWGNMTHLEILKRYFICKNKILMQN